MASTGAELASLLSRNSMPAQTGLDDSSVSAMRGLVDRFSADLGALRRLYPVEISAARAGPLEPSARLLSFYGHSPLPLVGVSIGMERERQQNDSLANGYGPWPCEP